MSYWPILSAVQVEPFPTLDDEPVTVADVVRHLRWPDGTPDEADIPRWIAAGRTAIERDTGIALARQTWRLELAAASYAEWIRLPLAPVLDLTVAVITNGVESAIDPASYLVTSGRPARLAIAQPHVPGDVSSVVRVTFTAGYPDAHAIPSDLIQAVLMNCADLTWHRGEEPEAVGARLFEASRRLTDRYVLAEP